MTCDADLDVGAGRDVSEETDLHEVLAGYCVKTSEDSNLDALQSSWSPLVSAEPDQAAQGVLTYLPVRPSWPSWSSLQVDPGRHEELIIEYFLSESLPHRPGPENFSLGKLTPGNGKPSIEVVECSEVWCGVVWCGKVYLVWCSVSWCGGKVW